MFGLNKHRNLENSCEPLIKKEDNENYGTIITENKKISYDKCQMCRKLDSYITDKQRKTK